MSDIFQYGWEWEAWEFVCRSQSSCIEKTLSLREVLYTGSIVGWVG